MSVKISYCIGTHNEGEKYLAPLFDMLLNNIEYNDEIIVVDDNSTDPETLRVLDTYSERINLYKYEFDGDFSKLKNFKKEKAKGDYIFDLDGDELLSPLLIKVLKETIYNNEDVDLFWVPRINIVEGITDDDLRKYGWRVFPGTRFINYPDLQGRIFKNTDEIKWINKVHEVITGHKTQTVFPFRDEEGKVLDQYCILHSKTIERQRKQNELYDQL